VVRETNRYAEQYFRTHKLSKRSKNLQQQPTTNEEMRKFLGIVIEMGLVQMPKVSCMDQKLFKVQYQETNLNYFSSSLDFSSNEKLDTSQDRLAKLNPLLILLKARFKSVSMPGSVVTIDETMIPWRGRLSFRQYISGKAHKYSAKMYKAADVNGYTQGIS
jgi:hypothetical protein